MEAVLQTRSKRAINRTILDGKLLKEAIQDPHSKISKIKELAVYADIRNRHRAFHPNGAQKILMTSSDIFAVLRTSPEEDEHILAMINITNRICRIEVALLEVGIQETHWYDLISGKEWTAEEEKLHIAFDPYDIRWLKPLS